jgi:hypothetical protein
MDQFGSRYRVPGPELAAALVPAIADESSRRSRRNALWLLRKLDLGRIASAGSSGALADALFAAADRRNHDLTANDALTCLFDLGDPRAIGLLTRDLPHRAEILDSGWSPSGADRFAVLTEFDPSLLNAICGALGRGDSGAGSLLPGRPLHTRHNALVRILSLLASWGPAAAPAVPEIIAMLPGMPVAAARALAAIGGPVPEATASLQAAAGAAASGIVHRVLAASTLRDLTGDTEPLLAAIRDGLGKQRDHECAARAARSIEAPPGWLVPALRAALAASGRNQRARAEVARTLCQFTADTKAVLPVMTELLQRSRYGLGGPVGGYAALETACDLGPAAGSLIPELTQFLDDPVFCPIAAKAILRAGPRGVSLGTLADHLVSAVGAEGGRSHERALELLREIRLLDDAAISPGMLDRLRDLAERPARVICSGSYDGLIRSDEALREMIRSFLRYAQGRDPGR